MNNREYEKMRADARRSVSRKYGFRQSSYINFKVESGYFFCLYFFADAATLTVKPMYADDLWWDIWNASENKKEPLSLRGTGAYSLAGQNLALYTVAVTDDSRMLVGLIEEVFQDAVNVISGFLILNPDAEAFYPDEPEMDHDPDRLLYMMALIHNGREEEVLAIIRKARKNKHNCMFQSGMFSDSYTYIRRWCRRRPWWKVFDNRILRKLIRQDAAEDMRRMSDAERAGESQKRKPWYRRLPEWLYWVVSAPVWIPLSFYFFDLHKRTLYDMPWWIWFAVSASSVLLVFVMITKNGIKLRDVPSALLLALTLGLFSGFVATGLGIAMFDGVNRLFADSEPISERAVVTNGKFYHQGRGRFDFSHHITVVELVKEKRKMKIDDVNLYDVPPQSEVVITYRKGLFGFDIFDSFNKSIAGK